MAFDVLGRLYTDTAGDVIRVLTHAGSYPVTGLLVIATAAWAARHQRAREGIALVVAHLLTFVAVHLAKDWEARPRPSGAHSDTDWALAIPPAIPPTRSPGSPARSCWRAAATAGRRASRS